MCSPGWLGAGQMYVNFTGDGDEDKARRSYPAETYARLAAVKAHYDPVNRFRFNQNIRPVRPGRDQHSQSAPDVGSPPDRPA
jgi:Berberine and berberine like